MGYELKVKTDGLVRVISTIVKDRSPLSNFCIVDENQYLRWWQFRGEGGGRERIIRVFAYAELTLTLVMVQER